MRQTLIIILCLALGGQTVSVLGQKPYDARIKGKEILTPEPSKKPQINSPEVYGARTDKPFIYRIPTTGIRPMEFEAVGLPPMLKLDREKGIITGRTPGENGEYEIALIAKNTKGKDKKQFTLVVGDLLALTTSFQHNQLIKS